MAKPRLTESTQAITMYEDSKVIPEDELEPLENILAEYDSVFKGIGCLPGEYDLEIDESITPAQVRPRKIPLSTKEEVKTKRHTDIWKKSSRAR